VCVCVIGRKARSIECERTIESCSAGRGREYQMETEGITGIINVKRSDMISRKTQAEKYIEYGRTIESSCQE
jgi:hypothetical protein